MNAFQIKTLQKVLKNIQVEEIKTSDLDVCHMGENHIGDFAQLEDTLKVFDINECPRDVFEMYGALGFNKTVMFNNNMNEKIEWQRDKPFDIIFNCNRSDLFFDQRSFFENVHDLAGVGTYMVHCVPYWTYVETGLYTYQPAFFARLCGINGYEMLGSYIGTSTGEQFEKINIHYEYQGNHYAQKHKYFAYSMGEDRGWKRPAHMSVVLRKMVDKPFEVPHAFNVEEDV